VEGRVIAHRGRWLWLRRLIDLDLVRADSDRTRIPHACQGPPTRASCDGDTRERAKPCVRGSRRTAGDLPVGPFDQLDEEPVAGLRVDERHLVPAAPDPPF